ncbi:MAG: UDP binding domain-containing protein, partial [Betaproteobacteria bacterium]
THKAEMIGYQPQMILAGRRINDGMGRFVAEQTIKQMIAAGTQLKGARVGVLGLTFKEDVPDIRNSRVIDLIAELRSYGVAVTVHDPIAAPEDADHEYGLQLARWEDIPRCDALVLAVPHRYYIDKPLADFLGKLSAPGTFIDIKSQFDRGALERAGIRVWRL